MSRTTRSALATLASLLVTAAPAAAADRLPAHLANVDQVPLELPAAGAARAAAAGDGWLLGAADSAAARGLARAHGARALAVAGTWRVPTGRARSLAAALRSRGLLRWAQHDAPVARASAFEGEGREAQWARGPIVAQGLTPPGPGAPIGIVDDLVDVQVKDVAHAKLVNGDSATVIGPHGTEVASVAAGVQDGLGVLGILPGAPILSYGLKDSTCEEVGDGVVALAKRGARVINLSLGSEDDCFYLQLAISVAFAQGSLTVASAGNEGDHGNPIVYPAVYPHVMSVSAVDQVFGPTYFTSTNAAVDISAPGEKVPVAIPPVFDTRDGVRDGLSVDDGTSFSAPIVAGVASWVLAARPKLRPGQLSDVLRHSAKDLGDPGWDEKTGYGLVDLNAALTAATPALDPLEPNDGITFVNGTAFTKPDPYVWTGGAARTLSAAVDAVEDPVDVFRIRIPARKRITVQLTPSGGNADLAVYDAKAKGLQDKALKRSSRGTGRTDTVHVRNGTRRARTAYVAVLAPSLKSRTFDAPYKLRLRRG